MTKDHKDTDIHDIHSNLVKACKNNDRNAQIRLYEIYAKAMYNTSLRIVKDTQWAEDIMQESFISAFAALPNFREEVPFRVWLKRIVINKSIDELRKNKPVFEELNEEVSQADEQIDWIAVEEENEQLVRKIKKAIKELPEGYRIILTLSLFEGYDHEEISKILNITASTSRSQLTRAKKKLNEKLKGSIRNYD